MRALKSDWELEQIRAAAEQLSHLPEWMARHVRVGMTELELAAEIERELRIAGHQGPIRFRSFNNELFYGSVLAGPSGAVPGSTETPIVGPGPNVAVSKGAGHRPIGAGRADPRRPGRGAGRATSPTRRARSRSGPSRRASRTPTTPRA